MAVTAIRSAIRDKFAGLGVYRFPRTIRQCRIAANAPGAWMRNRFVASAERHSFRPFGARVNGADLHGEFAESPRRTSAACARYRQAKMNSSRP